MEILKLDYLNSKINFLSLRVKKNRNSQSKLINKVSFNPLFSPIDELSFKNDRNIYPRDLNGLKALKSNISIKLKINQEKFGYIKNNS